MRTLNLFIFLFTAILFSSCDKGENDNPLDFQLGEPFELAVGNIHNCTCGNLSVSFTDVLEDSRCPLNAVCIWEGQARVQLDAQLNDGRDTIELISRVGYIEQARDTLDNLIFELQEVSPYPATSDPIPKEDYRIGLIITEL